MSEVKFTKNALRVQQQQLSELQKYLPTLQLKKAMLQEEVNRAYEEVCVCEKEYENQCIAVKKCAPLINEKLPFCLKTATTPASIVRQFENIAGIEVPFFQDISFDPVEYSLFDTPFWVDSLVETMRRTTEASVRVEIAQEKRAILDAELKDVSIKVNLFEKRLIPSAQNSIRKIKVFLGDQQLSAVSQAKAAKRKIENKKKLLHKRQEIQVMELLYAD